MTPFAEVEHTADWSLRVWAPTLEELFLDAARGMYALLGRGDEPAAGSQPAANGGLVATRGEWRPVLATGDDHETLLVAWLHELLYATEVEGVAFDDFRIDALTPTALRAQARGRPAARSERVIKAVTFHNLSIRPAPEGGYETTLVFDV